MSEKIIPEASGLAAPFAAPADRQCKWPVGEIGDADFHFCGAPRAGHRSYCASHAVQARATFQGRRKSPGRAAPGSVAYVPRMDGGGF